MNTVFLVHLFCNDNSVQEFKDEDLSYDYIYPAVFTNFDDAVQCGIYERSNISSQIYYVYFSIEEFTIFDNFESVSDDFIHLNTSWNTKVNWLEIESDQKIYIWYNVDDESKCHKVSKKIKILGG